jgi:DNA helicase-2/ATP-dependent DNA helicase PcrA
MSMQPKKETENLGLNPAQLDAVTAQLGPVLILAGAGSGKTRALTMRIVYLIKKMNFHPENILAVTFTNKAAGEMKERIHKLLGKRGITMPVMGTFHSIGSRILRWDGQSLGLDRNFVIYDTDDCESLLKEILLNHRIDPTKFKPSLFLHIIDGAKNNLQGPEDIEHGDKQFNRMAREVFAEFEIQLRKNNAVDFGDLISMPVRLFREHPEILKKYQSLWQYILVDEYQDTNPAQYEMTKLLASGHHNLFVVGDDAQAIYGFRGADLQNILNFEKDYPDAKIIRLEQNYRSTSHILSIAEKVIEMSPRQHKKRLWTENESGNKPVLYRADDELAESWFVAKTIIDMQDGKSNELQYISEDDDSILSRIMRKSQARVLVKLKNREGLNNIAVLYRTHAQSRAVEEMMIEGSIPYQIVGGLKFYERREIKDILAYLKLLVNPNDLVSLKRVINTPPRALAPKALTCSKRRSSCATTPKWQKSSRPNRPSKTFLK